MSVKAGGEMLSISPTALDLSVVMPCLDEVETLGSCISAAQQAVRLLGLRGEIVVADNGSTDGSQEIARGLGARLVEVQERGYGSALRAGIAAASGRYVVIGDADGQHDFAAIPAFVEKLRSGYELVVGNRFRGRIEPGAIPWKNRLIGNPVLSGLTWLFFRCPVGDVHCGMRAFTKQAFRRMRLCSSGMEFASEMVAVAALQGLRIAEIPITVHRAGRSRRPHLCWWRDGWRHLRLLFLLSPTWLFLVPGLVLFLGGVVASIWLLGGVRRIGPVVMDIHTLLVAGFTCLLGYQIILFGLFGKMLANARGLHRPWRLPRRVARLVRLETGVLSGIGLAGVGFVLLVRATWSWEAAGFAELNPQVTMRQVIPAVVLLMLGVQTVFGSFFLSLLDVFRNPRRGWLKGSNSPRAKP